MYLLFLKNRLILLKWQFFKDASQLICNNRKEKENKKNPYGLGKILRISALLTAENIY